MVSETAHRKDPQKVRAGQASARRRWGEGPSRILRLDALGPEERSLVHAFVRMAEATAERKAAAGEVEAPTAEREGQDDDLNPAA